jgi:hypothetical protein
MIFRKFLNLINGKKSMSYIWDMLLFVKNDHTSSGDIYIPTDKVLLMYSPKVNGSMKIDGEVRIG